MKIRNGFVSNSSSSSFLIAVGKINNRTAFEEYVEKNECVVCVVEYHEDFDAFIGSNWRGEVIDNILSVESFDGSILSIEMDKDSQYYSYRYIGDEGDGEFSHDYEMRYNIDASWFDNTDAFAIMNIPSDVATVEYMYGAGRNG